MKHAVCLPGEEGELGAARRLRSNVLARSSKPMIVPLVPCPSCARHVKQRDRICPFCGAECARASGAETPPGYRKGMSRSALFAAAAAAASVASTACSPSVQPLYGGSRTLVDEGGSTN